MDEFEFIRTHLSPLAGPEGLNLTDDAACLTPPLGCDLVLTKDTMVEGVHFPKGRHGGDTAEKLLRVNLSDLAAKGARPLGYLLSLALPRDVDRRLLTGFVKGLRDVQDAYDFTLWGGDTVSTSGPMIVTATLIGAVPMGTMVTRSGAFVGDDIWITGAIGDAYLGLQHVLGRAIEPVPDGEARHHWEEAYLRPEPRLLLRKLLRKYATAAVDISDGLVADISHICEASKLGADIHIEDVPMSGPTQTWLHGQIDRDKALAILLTAGDDYEVAFTSQPENRAAIRNTAGELGLELRRIGECREGTSVNLIKPNGSHLNVTKRGYTHL